ncbi:hypothetical protein NUU61_005102 [Penicillium alfredii]|uniref:Uncharacterized protein n=1 Tax=Penicillium alfredii TaxID=1506179 RepID=A0A9W9K7V3_9EURO|nr:uncharacterized protein NUU61_005102 [Penicillium alfredii]KAJ5095746.1 hypothetical protein NUU61_005102 [Penicillium alfredii]
MAAMLPPQGVRRGDILEVVHEFSGRGEDELTLKPLEKIELVELDEEFGDGWYLGKLLDTDKTGLFPGNYTRAAPSNYTKAPLTVSIPEETVASETTESPAQMEPAASAEPSSVASGETTPQASRHASASDIQPPQVDSPQPQRSASSPLPRPSLAADIQQTFRNSIDSHINGEESPVMNETLSVIDEHITDMNTPRHSISTQEPKAVNDSGSEYSSHLSQSISFINGHETDDEDRAQPTEEQVRKWNQTETAKHLRGLGVEPRHCDLFEEQEITGDVLLDMDQDFIFMKEFDFGVMGKRLKTWHKVKAFQEEVKGLKQPAQQLGGSTNLAGADERALSRAGHTGPLLPRIPSLSDKMGSGYGPPRASVPTGHPRLASNTSSPITPHTPPYGHDSPRRISAASIREFNHTRRHSSIDSTHRGMSDHAINGSHPKKPSFDRAWTLNTGTGALPSRPGTSLGTTSDGPRTFRSPLPTEPDSLITTSEQYDDLDRGYFSGTEVDSRRNRRVLQKRGSTGGSITHSRQSSFTDDAGWVKFSNRRRSRISSVDSIRDAAKHVSPAAQAYHGTPPPKSRLRSLSTRVSEKSGHQSQPSSATESKPGFFASFAPLVGKGDAEGFARSSPLHFQNLKNAGPKFRRAVGLRAISDVVGKGIDISAPVSPRDYDPMSARTGSTTPSATSKSSERHSTDGSGKAADGTGVSGRPRMVKSKKDTSAYIRGLEKKTPQEQMIGCDYSGWMKKRSSNLMTTWKPRLFVLRGRRLSYYYSENDTEERGLIDITSHRVLRADHDPIIALHATITGSTALPAHASPGDHSGGVKSIPPSVLASFTHKDGNGPFFFKLVPPKMGNSRTVQFTKPAIHYFQVDNVHEGRLWMAALMKATIERDLDHTVETTNKQKTISLKQARMMNQRPPALMGAPANPENEPPIEEGDENAELQIESLNIEKSISSDTNSFEDAKVDQDYEPKAADRPQSNPLGVESGHSPLLPDPLAKTESK